MKYILLAIYLIIINQKTQAQNDTTHQVLYIELGGANTLYSINTEKYFQDKPKWTQYTRMGIGISGLKGIGANASFVFVKKNNKHWSKQYGLGIAYNQNFLLKSSVSLQGLMGMRRKFEKGYLLLAINPSIHYFFKEESPVSAQFLYPSIGYGYYLKPQKR